MSTTPDATKPLTTEQRHHLATVLHQYVEQRDDWTKEEGARNILHASFDAPVLLELLRGYMSGTAGGNDQTAVSPIKWQNKTLSVRDLPVGTVFVEPDDLDDFPDHTNDTVWEVTAPGEGTLVSHASGQTEKLALIDMNDSSRPFLIIRYAPGFGPTTDAKSLSPDPKAPLGTLLPSEPELRTAHDPELGELLSAVDQADAAATPGPWAYGESKRGALSVDAVLPAGDKAARWRDQVDPDGNPERCTVASPPSWSNGPAVRPQSEADMRFIALARTALPALARLLRKSR